MNTKKTKMTNGELYNANYKELIKARSKAKKCIKQFNSSLSINKRKK